MKRQVIRIVVASVSTMILAILLPSQALGTITWSVGALINTPDITAPSSGAKYGFATSVGCSCNTPTDSDAWYDCPNSGNSNDAAIKATWSDGGAGGSWPGGNTGTSVTYLTPSVAGSVILTVIFDDTGTTQYHDAPTSDSVTISVVGAMIIFTVEGNVQNDITRALTGNFEVVDSYGSPIDGATYANWTFDGQIDVSDPSHTSRTWSGTIVEPGTASCNVTFGGNTAHVSKTIEVDARTSGWSITPACVEDNHPEWGDYPGQTDAGRLRQEPSHKNYIITPQAENQNFEDGYTTTEVTEVPSGPNDGVWYISGSTFVIEQETIINKFIKAGATGYPNPPNQKWHEYNESQSVDADGFLVGVKGHEYKGTGVNGQGHQQFLETKENDTGFDAKTEIENNLAATQAALVSATETEVTNIENAIQSAAAALPTGPTGNWGPPNTIRAYDFVAIKWINTTATP